MAFWIVVCSITGPPGLTPLPAAATTSASVIRSFGPVPLTSPISIPSSAARRLARGCAFGLCPRPASLSWGRRVAGTSPGVASAATAGSQFCSHHIILGPPVSRSTRPRSQIASCTVPPATRASPNHHKYLSAAVMVVVVEPALPSSRVPNLPPDSSLPYYWPTVYLRGARLFSSYPRHQEAHAQPGSDGIFVAWSTLSRTGAAVWHSLISGYNRD